jgi:hypothetical protein
MDSLSVAGADSVDQQGVANSSSAARSVRALYIEILRDEMINENKPDIICCFMQNTQMGNSTNFQINEFI